jgi:DeoR/GlpR family transcriptional regulator of sugar metabolism
VRVPQHIVDTRREKLLELTGQHGYLSVPELCRALKVSEATVRRDLEALEQEGRATRTYGGVVSDANNRFPSFRQRLNERAEEKKTLAQRARLWIRPGMTIFLDGGTTAYYLADSLRHDPIGELTVVTHNLPAADHLAGTAEVAVHLLGGQLMPRQSVLLGDRALRSAQEWKCDIAFLSSLGASAEGIWNTDPSVISVQSAMSDSAHKTVLLLEKHKVGGKTEHFLLSWRAFDGLVTDAETSVLRKEGIPVPKDEKGTLDKIIEEEEEKDLTLPVSLL